MEVTGRLDCVIAINTLVHIQQFERKAPITYEWENSHKQKRIVLAAIYCFMAIKIEIF